MILYFIIPPNNTSEQYTYNVKLWFHIRVYRYIHKSSSYYYEYRSLWRSKQRVYSMAIFSVARKPISVHVWVYVYVYSIVRKYFIPISDPDKYNKSRRHERAILLHVVCLDTIKIIFVWVKMRCARLTISTFERAWYQGCDWVVKLLWPNNPFGVLYIFGVFKIFLCILTLIFIV